MAYLGKEYKYEKHEKFDEFLEPLDIDKAAKEVIISNTSSQTLEKNGDSYTLTLKGYDGARTLNFKSGVEFDEKVGSHVSKTKITVDGNVVVQTLKFPNGHTITYKREYKEDKLVVSATNSEWNGVAYRYYSA